MTNTFDYQTFWNELLAQTAGKPVAVIGHHRPDGDCIGSTIGLTRMLQHAGVQATALNFDPCPEYLEFLLGDTQYLYDEEAKNFSAEYVITVDCAGHDRIGFDAESLFPKIDCNIDHHVSNTNFAEKNLVPVASATCEILANIAHHNQLALDPTTAQALYVGMVTDTGQFQYGATTSQTLQLASGLLDQGVRPDHVSHKLYANRSLASYKILQHFLATLEVELDGRFCYGWITEADLAKTGASKDDTGGLVNYTRSISGVDIGAYLEERGDLIKISLRSQFPRFAVHELAQQFGGGGHACAAGFSSELSIEEFRPILLQAVTEHIAKLDL